MKNVLVGLVVTILTFLAISMNAQQQAQFTHYMFNTLAVNPAYAGSRDALTVTALHRSQWVGFKGAPMTQTLTLHTPFLHQSLGLGISIINDKVGPTNETSFYIDFAYRIKINEKGHKLAFGLKGGGNIFHGGLTALSLDQDNDNSFSSDITSEFLPNFGFGIYYYAPNWYVGLAAPRLLENNLEFNNPNIEVPGTEKRHYYLIAGGVVKLSDKLKIKPTALVKYTVNAPIDLDLTATLIFRDRYWIGIMGRTGDAAGVIAGINLLPQLAVSYSFDWSFTNATAQYNAGSHEIMLRYDFIYKSKEKIKSPRYF